MRAWDLLILMSAWCSCSEFFSIIDTMIAKDPIVKTDIIIVFSINKYKARSVADAGGSRRLLCIFCGNLSLSFNRRHELVLCEPSCIRQELIRPMPEKLGVFVKDIRII